MIRRTTPEPIPWPWNSFSTLTANSPSPGQTLGSVLSSATARSSPRTKQPTMMVKRQSMPRQ